MSEHNASVLLVGGGSVGAIAALNIESSRRAAVTIVCRSNFQAVQDLGYSIESCDHGSLRGWRPSSVVYGVPDVTDRAQFDYVVCVTKNISDVPPSVSDLIKPAVTPGKTIIVLVQNGLNIEEPLLAAFPANIVLSGVSLIGANEPEAGFIQHDFPDTLFVGPFRNPNRDPADEKAAAEDFVRIYSAGGKTVCSYNADVGWTRWRKLTLVAYGLQTALLKALFDQPWQGFVAAAKASGYELPETIDIDMIEMDPLTMYLPPSMLSDVRKGNFIEYENIIGEPLREGEKLGVPMPTLRVLYHLCQAIQWKNKELKGLVTVPPKEVYAT